MRFDLDHVRSQFPALSDPSLQGWAMFENAGGSYACAPTIEALDRYYRQTKVQPYGPYPASAAAGEAMDRSRRRWAEALGVGVDEVSFGPSTSMNTYVLACAFGQVLGSGDEVVVTNQDHEANTGAIRRAAERAGATIRQWEVDPVTGELDIGRLGDLLSPRTRLVTMPHCSNLVGMENDVATVVDLAHERGARVIVDGVSLAPHGFPDVAALGADVYLFSLYKTFSVHQGLMVTANGIGDELPNQGHGFNQHLATKRLTPAGPDHAQEAAAGAVLDYVEALARHHRPGGGEAGGGVAGDGVAGDGAAPEVSLRATVAEVSGWWQAHEEGLLADLLGWLDGCPSVRLIGPAAGAPGLHRCPTVSFVPLDRSPAEVVDALIEARIMCWSGDFYARRLVQALGIDPATGVVRVSFVHYTSPDEVGRLIQALADLVPAGRR